MPHLYDAHQHFHFEQLTPHRAKISTDLARIGLQRAVVNGTNEEEWPVIAALALEYPWIAPSYGIHPWDCGNRSPQWLTTLRHQISNNPQASIGEIGLDRWIVDGIKPDDPRIAGLRVASLQEQGEVFATQLALAAEFNRAASIHCVQAWGKLLEILKTTPRPDRGFLLHGYSGPSEMIKNFADLGAYFSFNSQLLEARHAERLNNFHHIPANRLLVETDAPAKPPAAEANHFPLPAAADGSSINHPANITATYAALATLRGVSLNTLATQVERNFMHLFDTRFNERRSPAPSGS